PIPDDIIERNGLCPYAEALRSIHFPADMTSLERAKDYFIFEELYLFSAAVALSGGDKTANDGSAPHIDINTPAEDFYRALPFTLTEAQKRACGEILSDMSSGGTMKRLVSGDVGSGKTVCAAAAVYFSAVNGFQSAMMAPTEILASQHYADLSPLLDKFGIKSALLTGASTPAQKKRIYAGLADGSVMFCVGTHALLSEGVRFEHLGLAVTDEQHRFGVRQRNLLARDNPHVLVMSATPIPRTLAMILYGDLSVSAIDELPPGRQKVDTFVVGESYRARLNAFIEKQVREGHSVYIVCPSVEGVEDKDGDKDAHLPEGEIFSLFDDTADSSLPLKNTRDYADTLRSALPDIKIGVLHGRMKNAEKDAVMQSFADGSIQVLVSTTVIEVGVNVPNATLMIVENAERFGLSQLHQLRGRVGRGEAKSYCVLVSDSQTETARSRLAVMKNNSNGFDIAKYDLEQRGPGDFFPKNGDARQHGALGLRLASLCDNMDTLTRASECARQTIAEDPSLERHPSLASALKRILND
ncbi:MAG: ATP-dependent DNA helicase RecG, partial [Eubacteriales bacterium]